LTYENLVVSITKFTCEQNARYKKIFSLSSIKRLAKFSFYCLHHSWSCDSTDPAVRFCTRWHLREPSFFILATIPALLCSYIVSTFLLVRASLWSFIFVADVVSKHSHSTPLHRQYNGTQSAFNALRAQNPPTTTPMVRCIFMKQLHLISSRT
jgi:hypothetical protein